MALIRCHECGREVSDRAAACPSCGCPVTAATASPAQAPVGFVVGDMCQNGSCTGSVGQDGKCKVCGTPATAPTSPPPPQTSRAASRRFSWVRFAATAVGAVVLAVALGHMLDGVLIAANPTLRAVYEVCKSDPDCSTGLVPYTPGAAGLFWILLVAPVGIGALTWCRPRR
jgi:hypothetical protein